MILLDLIFQIAITVICYAGVSICCRIFCSCCGARNDNEGDDVEMGREVISREAMLVQRKRERRVAREMIV